MPAPKLIIFDCDGTLLDSQQLIVEAMRLTFIDFSMTPPNRSSILRLVGLSLPEIFATINPEACEEHCRQFAEAYRTHFTTLRQRPDMQEPMFRGSARLLMHLAAQDHLILGLATGKSRRGVQRFISNNNLERVFQTTQTADDAPSKPHPGMIEQAMADTNMTPTQTIMVGDTSYDMIMAQAAGTDSIGVTWGYHSLRELERANAKQIAHNFADLTTMLMGQQESTPQSVAA